MRFTTIWMLRYMSLPERLRRTRDWAAREIAFRLPKRVRYWVTLHEIGKATANSTVAIPDVPLNDILNNLDAPKVLC